MSSTSPVPPGPEQVDQGLDTPPDWLRNSASGVASAGVFLVLAPGPFATLASVFLLLRYRRHGMRPGLVATLAGLLATSALGPILNLLSGALSGEGAGSQGPGTGELVLAYAAVAALPALLLELAFRRTSTGARALELAAVGYLVVVAALLTVAGLAMEGGVAELVGRYLEQSLDRLAESSQQRLGQGGLGAEELALMEEQQALARRWGPRLFPGLLTTAVVLGLWMNVVYLRWFTGGEREKDDLTTWRLPMWVMYALMACIAGTVLQLSFGESLPASGAIAGAAFNGLLVLGVLYWLQGVAALNYWFLRLNPSRWIKLGGYVVQVFMMVIPPTSIMFGVLGLTDAWFDLRKLEPGAASGEEQ